jgi:phospholipase D1/2
VIRALLLAAVALAAAAAWWTGLYHSGPEHVAGFVERAGIWGPIAFVGLFVAAEVVHLPGILFMFAAAALWPARVAVPTAYIGALAASVVVFAIARRVVPAALRERLPERLLRYESLLESHGLVTVIGLRLALFMAPTVHWLLGASRVSSRDFVLGTALGLAPGVVALTLLGRRALDHWDGVQPWLLGGIAALAALAIVRRVRASAQ